MTKPDLTNTAPNRIYLDIGDQFALERVASGDLRWDLLDGVTWSEDNATSHGIPYVRADLVPTPAASGAAPADILSLLESAAYMCECYADFIKREVKAADIEQHPYLPELEGVAEDIRETLAALTPREAAALASPQVAPAPVPNGFVLMPVKLSDKMIETALEGHYGKRPVREAGGARGISMRANGTDYSGEEAMRRMWKGLLSATPVQVAPQPIGYAVERSAFRVSPHGQDAESREWMEFTGDPKEKGAFPVWAAPVAPQDDARDAAEEAVLGAFDLYARQFTYGNHPAKPQHFPQSFPWFKAGFLAAISTPAAKPTEEQGS